MDYTVKKLSKLSKVSVRTLHYYDEIDLLKPAYINLNGYRYYREKELLKLQQILFFRELGLTLKQIKKILLNPKFEKLPALAMHKKKLESEVKRLKGLIKTIENTTKHLKGEIKMSDEEIYFGFSKEKQKEYEGYILDKYGDTAKDLMGQTKSNTKSWTKEDWKSFKEYGEALNKELAQALIKGELSSSDKVQKLVDKHYNLIKRLYDPTQEVYINLGKLYCEHEDFRDYYDAYGKGLAKYLADAMRVYAKENLS